MADKGGGKHPRRTKKKARSAYEEPEWARPPGDKFKMLIFHSEEMLEQISISTSSCYIFGRSGSSCDFKVSHESVSRQHAVLQYGVGPKASPGMRRSKGHRGRPPWLYDLGSTHGTKLNGKTIPSRKYMPLEVGDVVEFGTLTNRYVLADPENIESLTAAKGTYQPKESKVKSCKETHTNGRVSAQLVGLDKRAGDAPMLRPRHVPLSARELRKNPYERITTPLKFSSVFNEPSSSSDSEINEIRKESQMFPSKTSLLEPLAFSQSSGPPLVSVDGTSEGIGEAEEGQGEGRERGMTPWREENVAETAEMKYFGGWERYTKGIGLKILQKYGYVKGKGLGVGARRGIVNPVVPRICPPGVTLDYLDGNLATEKGRKAAARAAEMTHRMVTGEGVNPEAELEQKLLAKIIEGTAVSVERASVRETDTRVFDVMNQHCSRVMHETDVSSEDTRQEFLKKAADEALGGKRSRKDLPGLRRKLLRVRMDLQEWKTRLQQLSGQSRAFEQTEGTQRQVTWG
ncbi:hypothetical protein AAMO2058_000504400 [Amorphochlora amoebiformis]